MKSLFEELVALFRSPLFIAYFTATTVGTIGLAFAYVYYQARFDFIRSRPDAPIEAQLTATLNTLQENSEQAMKLLELMQAEVARRTTAAQEIERNLKILEQQRALLELTPDQRQAIEGLLRRQPSMGEIFKSLDFWVGRVLPSGFFFTTGIFITLGLQRKKAKQRDAQSYQ